MDKTEKHMHSKVLSISITIYYSVSCMRYNDADARDGLVRVVYGLTVQSYTASTATHTHTSHACGRRAS